MVFFSKLLSAAAGVFTTTAAAGPLADGAAVPEVSQKNQDGEVVKLAEAGATGWLMVYFYPKAGTPGCTRQACGMRDSYEQLARMGVRIFGVSIDAVKSQKAFKTKHHLPFDLLADEDAAVVTAFGVPRKLGFASRQAFLFKDGRLVWRDLSASTDKQAGNVLAWLAANP